MLRFGYPRHSEILAIPELLGPSGNLDELSSRVQQASREIKQAEQEHRKSSELAVLRAKHLLLRGGEGRRREHTGQCAVVATTTTLSLHAEFTCSRTALGYCNR